MRDSFSNVLTKALNNQHYFTQIIPRKITKIAGSSKWEVLDGGQTGSSGDGKYYVVSDANSRTITVFNREGNNRTITVHGMGRLASVTAQATI